MTAKTNAERQKAWRERNKPQGEATEVRGIFAHPEDHAPIKAAAMRITRKRLKAPKE